MRLLTFGVSDSLGFYVDVAASSLAVDLDATASRLDGTQTGTAGLFKAGVADDTATPRSSPARTTSRSRNRTASDDPGPRQPHPGRLAHVDRLADQPEAHRRLRPRRVFDPRYRSDLNLQWNFANADPTSTAHNNEVQRVDFSDLLIATGGSYVLEFSSKTTPLLTPLRVGQPVEQIQSA